MKNVKSEDRKDWFYISIRYRTLSENIQKKTGDLLYKANFLIYTSKEEVERLQDTFPYIDIWISCNQEDQEKHYINVFDFIDKDKLDKNYCYVNFFEYKLADYKFKFNTLNCEHQGELTTFLNSFFWIVDNQLDLNKKSLKDLVNDNIIKEITSKETLNIKTHFLFNGEKQKIKREYKGKQLENSYFVLGKNDEVLIKCEDNGEFNIIDRNEDLNCEFKEYKKACEIINFNNDMVL